MTASSRLGVVGDCGHIGLPLAIAFALAGHHVLARDVNEEAMARVRRGEMPFREQDADRLPPAALASGRLSFSAERSVVLLVRSAARGTGLESVMSNG